MNSIATTWSKATLALLLIAVFALSASASFAQGPVDKYTLEKISAKFATITASKGPTAHGGGDDATYATSLPFDFNYDDTKYTTGASVKLNTNGWLELNATAQPAGSPWTDRFYPNYSYQNSIYVLSSDLYVNSSIYSVTQGSAPNRVYIVEWNTVRGYNGGSTTSMQIKLYETSNVIEFIYESPSLTMDFSGASSGTASAGLHGGAKFTYNRAYGPDKSAMPSSSFKFTPPSAAKPQLTVGPKSINFGQYAAGQSSPTFDVTVSNVGSGSLIIGSATVSNTDFKIVSSPASNTFAAGQSGVYKIQFSPLGSGTRTGTFNVVSNGLDSGSQSVSLSGFGVAPQVQYEDITNLFRKTRTRLGESRTASTIIRSTGNGPLTIGSIRITGEYANHYSIVHAPAGTIAAGAVDSVVVRYTPREEGLRTANLEIVTNAIQNPNKTIQLFGLGIMPHLTITPRFVQFDSVAIGDSAFTTIRLYNSGADTLAVRADYVTFADKDFSYFGLEGADSLIAPEKFRDVTVRFIPSTRGLRQGRVRFTTNIPMTFETPVRDTSTFIVDVQGTGVPYGILVLQAPTSIDSSIIGTQVCQTVKIMNNGQSSLTITSAALSGADASEFSIAGVTFPLTLQPMSSANAQVCGTPSARGLRSAVVTVNGMSGDRASTIQLPLAVYGLLQCAQPSATSAFAGEIVRVGTTKSAQIIVNNCGDVPTTYNAVVSGAGYTLTSPASSGVIAPGGLHTFDVAFNPSSMALQAGTLTISGNGVANMVIDLAGTGGDVMIAAANTRAPETALGTISPEFSVSVTNNGNLDLAPGAPSVSNTEFTYVAGSGPAVIAAGQTETFKFTFSPAASGNRSAQVTFPGSDPLVGGGFMLNGSTPTGAVRPVASNGYTLGQNYPNPFNPSTVITFTMAEAGMAKIIVSDVTGNVVTIAAEGFFQQGENSVSFDASSMASGSYFYELVTGGVRLQRSMLLSK